MKKTNLHKISGTLGDDDSMNIKYETPVIPKKVDKLLILISPPVKSHNNTLFGRIMKQY